MKSTKTKSDDGKQLPSLNPDQIAKKLRESLKAASMYRASHEFLIESCAESIAFMRKCSRELRALDSLVVTKTSREGNDSPVPHPLCAMYAQASETVRRNLAELLVTPKASTSNTRTRKDTGVADADDPMIKMMAELAAIGDD